VVVVLDALPTASLLDGTGRIDAELYPHLAAFAEDATWYRNHTTTAAATFQAVPALLTGRLPELSAPMPDVAFHPGNLFSLLAGTHDVEAVEQITRLCPPDVCPRGGGGALRKLLGDAVEWWRGGLLAERHAGRAPGGQCLRAVLAARALGGAGRRGRLRRPRRGSLRDGLARPVGRGHRGGSPAPRPPAPGRRPGARRAVRRAGGRRDLRRR